MEEDWTNCFRTVPFSGTLCHIQKTHDIKEDPAQSLRIISIRFPFQWKHFKTYSRLHRPTVNENLLFMQSFIFSPHFNVLFYFGNYTFSYARYWLLWSHPPPRTTSSAKVLFEFPVYEFWMLLKQCRKSKRECEYWSTHACSFQRWGIHRLFLASLVKTSNCVRSQEAVLKNITGNIALDHPRIQAMSWTEF